MTAMDALFNKSSMKCTLCGAGMGNCDCWEQCTCGWTAEKGKPCSNPKTARCSTKLKYGKYNRSTKRYE